MDRSQTPVTIDSSLIPKEDWQIACSVLNSSLRIAFANPKLKAEYEAWKRKRDSKMNNEESRGNDEHRHKQPADKPYEPAGADQNIAGRDRRVAKGKASALARK